MTTTTPFAAFYLDVTGDHTEEQIAHALAKQDSTGRRSETLPSVAAGLAPAHGLTLVEVTYPNNIESIGQ